MNCENAKTSAFGGALVWFGAAVSIAEIQTGIDIAANASGKALASAIAAILAGHLAGGFMLYAIGVIGARLRKGAMDCVKLPFGRIGAGLLASLNIIQLLGWTAFMIAQGAEAASSLFPSIHFVWSAYIIGALVALWVFIGIGGVAKINIAAMSLLFILTLYMSTKLFGGGATDTANGTSSAPAFWSIFELSAAMPLSWLPLVADYTHSSRTPRLEPAISAIVYSIVSCWMFAIGLTCGLRFPGVGFAKSILNCGIGLVGLVVVVFSTVTTTFLDAFSAGESAKSIVERIPSKAFAVAVTAAGTAIAIYVGTDRYLDFLYLIASVFAPMAAVQLVDWLSNKGSDNPRPAPTTVLNSAAWLIGVVVYRIALVKGCPCGATIPAMITSAAIAVFGKATR